MVDIVGSSPIIRSSAMTILGVRLMVGPQTLDLIVLVRVQHPQPQMKHKV